MKNLASWLISMLVVVLLVSACGGGDVPTEAPANVSANIGTDLQLLGDQPIEVGETVPDVQFQLDGSTRKLSDYRGKTVVLNFWATWCGPCRLEMPDFEALSRDHADVAFLGINFRENAEQVQKFANEVGVTFPLILDRTGDVAGAFNARNLPVTYFIDKDGLIQRLNLGAMTRSQITQYLDELK